MRTANACCAIFASSKRRLLSRSGACDLTSALAVVTETLNAIGFGARFIRARAVPSLLFLRLILTTLCNTNTTPCRLSQSLIHFSNDEASITLSNSAEARFLAQEQEAERNALRARLEGAAAEKAAFQQERVEQERMRQRHEARVLEMFHMRAAEDKTSAFHRRVTFMREQHATSMTHAEARHNLERKQLVESQDIEARNLRLAQELEAKQLPPHMQAPFLQLCEMAARQLRATQDRRATRLNEVQLLESQHGSVNFDRYLKMATERFHMDIKHMGEEQQIVSRHVSVVV
jgi:hypothetical protein